jgi:hypothetical protein
VLDIGAHVEHVEGTAPVAVHGPPAVGTVARCDAYDQFVGATS